MQRSFGPLEEDARFSSRPQPFTQGLLRSGDSADRRAVHPSLGERLLEMGGVPRVVVFDNGSCAVKVTDWYDAEHWCRRIDGSHRHQRRHRRDWSSLPGGFFFRRRQTRSSCVKNRTSTVASHACDRMRSRTTRIFYERPIDCASVQPIEGFRYA